MYGKDEVQDGKMSSKKSGLFAETGYGHISETKGKTNFLVLLIILQYNS